MEREHKNKSVVWSFFTKKGDYLATCKGCHKDYSYKTSVSNLGKHWERHHGPIAGYDFDGNSDHSDEEQDYKNKTVLWSYFPKKKRFSIDYSYKTSVSNLGKHWERHHGPIAGYKYDGNSDHSDEKQKILLSKKKSNPTWKYFEVLDSDKFEANCKICEESIPYESVSDLAKHVRDHGENPKDSDDDDDGDDYERIEDTGGRGVKKGKKNSKLWEYFKIIDDDTKIAACLYCKRILTYAGSITNLKRHLVRKHPHTEELLAATNRTIYVEDTATQGIDVDDMKDPIEMDTVYLEDLDETIDEIPTPQPQIKTPQKKEKISVKRHFKSISKEPVSNSRRTHLDKEPPQKQIKLDTMGSLDYFGQYVVSLLKELPKSASDQLQNEIIMQIFAKKATLQQNTSTKYSIAVTDNRLHRSCDIITEPVTVTIKESCEENSNNEVMVPESTDNDGIVT